MIPKTKNVSAFSLKLISLFVVLPWMISFPLAFAQEMTPVAAVEPQAVSSSSSDEAQQLYQKYQKCLYQIRVVNIASGKIAGLGSGFQFTPDGHIATNYHVVSESVLDPTQYRLEYRTTDHQSGALRLLEVDVVHDLAIVQGDMKGPYLDLGEVPSSNGAKIFSLGNPHDLGMVIVEGTYNGLIDKSMYRKIHFSGSLNGGVSGGPTINHEGQVVGINVSTYGNQLSFLVPVDYLKDLYARLPKDVRLPSSQSQWTSRLEEQLVNNQDQYIQRLLKTPWNLVRLSKAEVPGEIASAFKCWGDSSDKPEELVKRATSKCSTEDYIYISPEFYTGQITYRFGGLKSKGLNTFRFYNFYENAFSPLSGNSYYDYAHDFRNAGGDDATNFQCETSFVKVSGQDWKVALCARRYKKFQQLFDVEASLALVSKLDEGFVVELAMLGITKSNALAFLERMLKEIKWRE